MGLFITQTSKDRYVDGNIGDDLKGANDCLDPKIPCQTLTHAIKKATVGDVIKVAPGTYTNDGAKKNLPVNLEKQLSIVALSSDSTQTILSFFQGTSGAAVVIKKGADGSILQGFTITVANPTTPLIGIQIEEVSSIQIRGNKIVLGTDNDTGILLNKSSASQIVQNEIQGKLKANSEDCEILSGQAGIRIENSHAITLVENRIRCLKKDGISLQDARNSTLRENAVKTTGQYGISLVNSSKIELSGNIVTAAGGDAGINLNTSDENTLINNQIDQNKDGLNLTKSNYNRISYNMINSNSGVGIRIQASDSTTKYNLLVGNIIEENDFQGIVLVNKLENVELLGNKLTKNKAGGIALSQDSKLLSSKIKDNIVNNNGSASATSGTTGGINFEAGIVENSEITGNWIHGNLNGSGLALQGTGNSLFENVLSGNEVSGINISSGWYNKVSRNTTIDNKEWGISVSKSERTSISENVARQNQGGIQLDTSDNNTLVNNRVENNRCNGIQLVTSNTNSITSNVSKWNARNCPESPSSRTRTDLAGGGIMLKGSSTNRLTLNTTEDNFNGLSVQGSSKKNTFLCNSVKKNDQHGIQLIDQATDNRFNWNNVSEHNRGSGLRNFLDVDQAIDATNNWWGSRSGPRHPDNPDGTGDRILGGKVRVLPFAIGDKPLDFTDGRIREWCL
jgi:parallel beta-helix repeat protein